MKKKRIKNFRAVFSAEVCLFYQFFFLLPVKVTLSKLFSLNGFTCNELFLFWSTLGASIFAEILKSDIISPINQLMLACIQFYKTHKINVCTIMVFCGRNFTKIYINMGRLIVAPLICNLFENIIKSKVQIY